LAVGEVNAYGRTVPAPRTVLPERNLDVLRAFAVSSVLADHVYMAMSGGSYLWLAYWLGQAGVLAFFVHTSLVLMSSLERQGDGPAWVRTFYIRRAFRIYPLAIASIAFVVFAHIGSEVPLGGTTKAFVAPKMSVILSNVLLVQNLAGAPNLIRVLWSLPIEVQMYVVLPLCYLIARKRPLLLAPVFVLGIAGTYARIHEAIPGLWRVDLLFYVPCFLCGVLAYAMVRRRRSSGKVPSRVWMAFLPALLATYAIFFVPHNVAALTWDRRPWMQWTYCLAIALMIPAVAELPEGIFTRTAHTVAKYSYGVYLLHVPSLWISFTLFPHTSLAARMAVALVLIIALPVIAFHAIESPCIRLGMRFATMLSSNRETAFTIWPPKIFAKKIRDGLAS
jgi:peptidoglycan/LPS O-acetylase OafA/YrhL